MKQRVNISMALVSASELLIADEPGTSLDVTIEDQIMRLLKRSSRRREYRLSSSATPLES